MTCTKQTLSSAPSGAYRQDSRSIYGWIYGGWPSAYRTRFHGHTIEKWSLVAAFCTALFAQTAAVPSAQGLGAATPPSDAPSTGASDDDIGSTWKGAFVDSLRLLMMEHTGRVVFQAKTRRELGGPFFGDYAHSVKWPRQWEDGDGWFVNYVGHPLHGAAAGRTWIHSDPYARSLELSLSKEYWTSRGRAARWSAFYSLQFEVGPLSEASIGNVGLNPSTTGWVDHVVTPVGAFGFIVAEDALDKYLVQLVERHTGNRTLRGTLRVILNPSRALANIAEGRTPWFRDRGPLQCCGQ